MADKKFILNADDFGMTKENNRAVLSGYINGFLTSASLTANGEAFDSAVYEILPECQNLGIGVHLNIIEGKPLTECKWLAKNGAFNNGYLALILKSSDSKFLDEIEKEFRAQIETVMKYAKPDHIDSHVHTHAIPNIFRLVCKLAKEYNIPFVRTQHEHLYFVPRITKHINFKYPPNLLKVALLNSYTSNNKNTINEYGLKTNDYILGVGYTGLMDKHTVRYGLEALEEGGITEALIHPCQYTDKTKNQHFTEFQITQNKKLEDKIKRLGFEITNYKNMI